MEFGAFIGGKWVRGEETWTVRSPYDGSPVGVVHAAGPDLVDEAIAATVEGASAMRRMPTYQRQEMLQKVSLSLRERQAELAVLIAQEAGKPLKHARAEVARAASTFSLAAGTHEALWGQVIPLDVSPHGARRWGIVRRFPLGVIAGITPFNFPLNLVAHKVAPALAAGNAIVVKPASATPLTALRLAQLVHEAGAPPGAFNVVPARASCARALVTDDRIAMVSFTGSAEVGWDIKAHCGKKRVCLELGGNAAVIVESDADLDKAVPRIVLGGYAYAGQVCISVQRIFVHESVFAQFMELFVPAVQALVVGDPLDERTDVGPVIDDEAASRIEAWIKEAEAAGGRVLTGGRRQGRLVEPTVLVHVPEECAVVREEAFAPLTVVFSYQDLEEALARVNRSRFGLQAGIFTSNLSKVWRAFETIEVGGLVVNDSSMFRVDHMPYGGVKDSGLGREGIAWAMREMTEERLLVVEA